MATGDLGILSSVEARNSPEKRDPIQKSQTTLPLMGQNLVIWYIHLQRGGGQLISQLGSLPRVLLPKKRMACQLRYDHPFSLFLRIEGKYQQYEVKQKV